MDQDKAVDANKPPKKVTMKRVRMQILSPQPHAGHAGRNGQTVEYAAAAVVTSTIRPATRQPTHRRPSRRNSDDNNHRTESNKQTTDCRPQLKANQINRPTTSHLPSATVNVQRQHPRGAAQRRLAGQVRKSSALLER